MILLAEAPATPEEEAAPDELPEVTAEDVVERLRSRIGSFVWQSDGLA